jgi:hypothetical protein
MKRLLIIPMAIIELILIGSNWVIALVSPSLGKKFMEWNMAHMPDKEWYNDPE